jgi:hypothetical protein
MTQTVGRTVAWATGRTPASYRQHGLRQCWPALCHRRVSNTATVSTAWSRTRPWSVPPVQAQRLERGGSPPREAEVGEAGAKTRPHTRLSPTTDTEAASAG